MKILFLQNMHDATGGITNVNITLSKEFSKCGDEVFIYSLRNGGYNININYPDTVKTKVINSVDEWGCPRLSEAVSLLKKGKVVKSFKQFFNRVLYDFKLNKDFSILKENIENLNPDVIIVSHYELFPAIPEEYLKRTISHYHTNFSQLKNNRGQVDLFKKYNDKLAKFVWLSKQTSNEAVEFGITNSSYIYNPIMFSCPNPSCLENKKAIFIGRFSDEKRVGLIVELFERAIKSKDLSDWKLELYGVNATDQNLIQYIEKTPNVNYFGKIDYPEEVLKTSSIFMLASLFEGFPLVVIEANECGVPCIAFDFGETSNEVISKETGYIIPQGEEDLYVERLQSMMRNIEERKMMGKNAKEFAKSFNVEYVVKQWYALFNELR